MMARMARRVNVMLVGNWVDEENQKFFVYTGQSEVRNKDSGMASRHATVERFTWRLVMPISLLT